MNTLVIYASKHGTVGRCASMLCEKLIGRVDLYKLGAGSIPDLKQYDKIIIGGSIYAGKIQKEVSRFCSKNLNALKEKKIGLFICCMNKKGADMQLNNAFPKELTNVAMAKGSFGGEFKFKEMNFIENLITKMVSKSLAKEDPSLVIDTKKDLSLLSIENINKFATLINGAGK